MSAPVTSRRSREVQPARATMRGWKSILKLMAAALALWLLLDATTLQHNAQVSPVGIRRTVALDLLGPIAAVARVTQVSRLETGFNQALGRTATGSGGHTFVVVLPPAASTNTQVSTGKAHPPIHPDITTIPPNPMQNPTAANPVRVLLIGDSLGLDLGDSLQNSLASTGVVAATLDGKESTGLTRPDYFNWPAELASDLPKVSPEVVVVMMGANDPQAFPSPSIQYGTAAWNAEYLRRCIAFMKLATSTGATLIWVSLPPMQDPTLNAKVANINAIQKEAAAQVPNVIYVNSNPTLAPAGTFQPYILSGGQNVNVRTPDGTHISPQGGALLSQQVMGIMRTKLGIPLPG